MKKLKAFLLISLSFCAIYTNAEVKQYESEYIKGDIVQKEEAVKKAALEGDNIFCLQALDFALQAQDVLGDDVEIYDLAEISVQSLKYRAAPDSVINEIAQKLSQVFAQFQAPRIRIAVLKQFRNFPSFSAVSLVNSYLTEQAQKTVYMDTVTLEALHFLRDYGNSTSFSIMFISDLMGIWTEQREELQASYAPLADSCKNEIISILSGLNTEKKKEAVLLIAENKNISKKICGEIAENVLSWSISNMGDNSDIQKGFIDLQLTCASVIASTQWTRASALMTDYFNIARNEYENNILEPAEFAVLIQDIASVGSSKTGQVLALYLDFLNRSMENNVAPVEVVVLSVINALGELGDKTAFDYLLYVTYLDYPDEVVMAARNALAKLKW